MPQRVLHQRLQQKTRHGRSADRGAGFDARAQPVGKTDLLDRQIALQEFQFRGQRGLVSLLGAQHLPGVVQALQFWADLSGKEKIQPPGTIEWGTTPKDFFEHKTAIIWTSTGNLTNVRKNAPFPFGVAILPAHNGRGSPTGGGNFYFFKKMSPAQRKVAEGGVPAAG